jgi:hypothetical protein
MDKRNQKFTTVRIVTLTLILAALHLLYATGVGFRLYESSGGVRKEENGWTRFGGAGHAWELPVFLPGTMLLHAGQKIYGLRKPPYGIFGSAGILAILVGSCATACIFAFTLEAIIARKRPFFGRYGWRWVVIAAGLLWIPVPEVLSLAYQYTIVY